MQELHMKINDIVYYNNKKWKIIAIKGNYSRIRLVGSRAEKIVALSDLD